MDITSRMGITSHMHITPGMGITGLFVERGGKGVGWSLVTTRITGQTNIIPPGRIVIATGEIGLAVEPALRAARGRLTADARTSSSIPATTSFVRPHESGRKRSPPDLPG